MHPAHRGGCAGGSTPLRVARWSGSPTTPSRSASRCPPELAEEYAFPARPVADAAPRRRGAGRTRSARPPGAPLRVGVREVAGGAVLRVAGARAAPRRRGRGRAAVRPLHPGRHLRPPRARRRRLRITPCCPSPRRARRPGRQPRHAALRQPPHRHGDVRRRAGRPQGRATRPGWSWCTCCPGRPARSSCSPAGSTRRSCARCWPRCSTRVGGPLVALRAVRDGRPSRARC